jgi:hypothetical protein
MEWPATPLACLFYGLCPKGITIMTKTIATIAAPKAVPAHVSGIRAFDQSRTELAKSLKGATAQQVVLAVAEVKGCPVKRSTSARANTEWILDNAHAKYEGAKTLLRDVNDVLSGQVTRGKKQADAKAEVAKAADTDAAAALFKALERIVAGRAKLSVADRRRFAKLADGVGVSFV